MGHDFLMVLLRVYRRFGFEVALGMTHSWIFSQAFTCAKFFCYYCFADFVKDAESGESCDKVHHPYIPQSLCIANLGICSA